MSELIVLEHGKPHPCPDKQIVGVVYFIRAAKNTYKVGCTVDIDRRLRTLQREREYPLKVIAVIDSDDYTRTEWAVHLYLIQKGLQLTGEWFIIDDYVLSLVVSNFGGRWI